MCMYEPEFRPDQCIDELRTCFGHEEQRTSGLYGQLSVSDAIHCMDGPMTCCGHDERHASCE